MSGHVMWTSEDYDRFAEHAYRQVSVPEGICLQIQHDFVSSSYLVLACNDKECSTRAVCRSRFIRDNPDRLISLIVDAAREVIQDVEAMQQQKATPQVFPDSPFQKEFAAINQNLGIKVVAPSITVQPPVIPEAPAQADQKPPEREETWRDRPPML